MQIELSISIFECNLNGVMVGMKTKKSSAELKLLFGFIFYLWWSDGGYAEGCMVDGGYI